MRHTGHENWRRWSCMQDWSMLYMLLLGWCGL